MEGFPAYSGKLGSSVIILSFLLSKALADTRDVGEVLIALCRFGGAGEGQDFRRVSLI